MTQTLSDMSLNDAVNQALELILYGNYQDALAPTNSWRTPFEGSFADYVAYELSNEDTDDDDDEITAANLDEQSVWEHLKYEGSSGTRDGWTGKVEASFGGEGEGDQYWIVVSVSDGTTTRYFRKDGWYASYDGGYLDGDTTEVTPVEKTVIVWKS